MTDWMIILTHASSKLVNVIIFLLACLILFVVTRRITGPAVLAFTLGGVSVLNWVLKTWLQRARPDVLHEVQVSGYSFPSGHAMLSAAFFGMLGYIIWSALKRRHSAMAWPALIIVYALILIIGISRIYLQVHFPSDVIAGYAAGFFWLILSIKVWQAVHEKQEHSQRVRLDLR